MRPTKFRGNIFVANLPHGYTDEQLAQAFDGFGLVLGAYLARDPLTGTTKGYGLVNLAPEKVAAKAAAAFNGTKISGRTVEAKLADPEMAITLPSPGRRPPMMREPEPLPAPTRTAFPAVAAPPRKVIVEYRTRRVS
jgi:RNA recognition motif-containing protein